MHALPISSPVQRLAPPAPYRATLAPTPLPGTLLGLSFVTPAHITTVTRDCWRSYPPYSLAKYATVGGMVHAVKNATEGVMPDDERMSTDERRKHLRLVAQRYAKAGRVERSRLLTEIVR